MGQVTRGLVALVAALLLSTSVTPAVVVSDPLADGSAPTAVTPSPPAAGPSPPIERSVAAIADSNTATTVASRRTAQDGDTIYLVQEFERLPDDPGLVRVHLRYVVPSRVTSLRAAIEPAGRLVTTDGFTRVNETHVEWTGATDRPTLTYDLPVNRTTDRAGPQGASGRYLAADTADWSLFRRPTTPTYWAATRGSRIAFDRRSAVDGPGAAGEWLVFLGEQETYERRAHDQRFRLVVPAAANLSQSPGTVLDAMAASSDALRVGDRDGTVFVVAAPTDGVRWGVRGLQTGDSDMWVRASERVDTPDSPWIHEYVHTRQSFTPTGRTLWFEEASASYYAALLALEHDAIEFEGFRDRLRAGSRPTYDGVVLANRSTWRGDAQYDKGALVAGQLDRRLRTATDREQTLQDVFREMNGQRGPVTQLDFLEALAAAGGTDLLDTAQRYTGTRANVSMWNRTTHAAVFGQLPARVGYELGPVGVSDAYRIGGPYRNATAAAAPIRLVTGERLAVDATVSNVGGTTGQYNLSMRVNGTVVDETSGSIGASESRTVTLSHAFPTPGTYTVSIDGQTVRVTVARPATARVAGLSVDETNVRQGESVTLTATVFNRADRPGEATVVFTRDFEEVARTSVFLPANGRAFVSQQVALPRAGVVELGAGSVRPVEVSVEPAPVQTGNGATAADPGTPTPTTGSSSPSATTRSPSSGDGSGFGTGPLAVAGGLLALLAVLAGRR